MMDAIDDIVERHIISYLKNLKEQNLRLKAYIEKSGLWSTIKDIEEWKPYDFFHYFCSSYRKKYRKEYKISGSIVRGYQRIEQFLDAHDISNQEYKSFIDKAFARYFTEYKKPMIGSICSFKLFNKLMSKKLGLVDEDWFSIEQSIKQENEKFVEYLEQDRCEDYLDVISKAREELDI